MTKIYQKLIPDLRQTKWPVMVLFSIITMLFLTVSGYGQNTYNWQGGNNSWATGNRWIPNRNSPNAADTLIISNGGTVTLTSIPTQTIGQIRIKNNTYAILQTAAANNTLTIGGGTGPDLIVEAGSTLEINTNNSFNIRIAAGATAYVTGNIIFSGNGTHTIDAVDAEAIVFKAGSTFTQNSTGNAFTSAGTNETVVFENGSTYIQQSGAHPFGKTQPNSKVQFNTGSLYSHRNTSFEPSFTGRTYANFEINAPGYTQTSTGTNGLTVDNFTVVNVATMTVNLTGGITIKGNLDVQSGTLNFNPSSTNTITFGGSGNQNITGNGTLSFNANTKVAMPGIVTLQKDLTISGPLNVDGTLKFDGTTARILTLAGSMTGTGTIDMSGGNLGHVLNLGSTVNSIANIITSPTCNSTINYNGAGNQIIMSGIDYGNLTISGGGIKSLGSPVTVCKALTITTGATLSLSGFDATVNGSTFVAGTLNAGITSVMGTGSFTLNGTLVTASPDGINAGTSLGSLRVSGTRNLLFGSFIYDGTVSQFTGNGLPTIVENITINNTAATPTVSLSQNLTVNKLAAFTAGAISIGSNTLSLNGTTALGTGTIIGGTTSNLSIGGSSGLNTDIPFITNGLFNLTISKTGSNAGGILRPGGNVVIYDGGTLSLLSGFFSNANTLTMGENASAITNIIRKADASGIFVAPTFNNLVNVTYTASTTWGPLPSTGPELPVDATVLNNLTIGTGNNTLVTLGSTATPVVNGTFTINTTVNSATATSGLNLNGRTLTINGNYVNNSVGTFTGSSSSSIIINGDNKSISGTLRFSQVAASLPAARTLQNFTLNRTGTGSAFTISTPVDITNAFITSGTLTATGTDIYVGTASVEASGRFVNNTTAVPSIFPTSSTSRAFNNTASNSTTGSAFVNKFDRYQASNDAGNTITNTASDITFTRNGQGSVYAFRNKMFNPVPNTAVVQFQLGVTSTVGNTSTVATLMIGSNLGDDALKPTAAARLQFNLTTSNNKISVTSPDGTPYTSADNLNLGQNFTWVINNSGAPINYTGPNGVEYNLATGRSELWHNTTKLASNLQLQDVSQAINQIKFVMDDGSGSISLKNLRINPLATITTASVCYTAGYVFNVSYTVNTIPGAATPASASFNEGNEFRVQISNSSGNFDPNNNNDILGRITSTATSGTIPVTIPLYATGTGYRYRVISSNLNISTGTNNGTSMYFISPGNIQSMIKSTSGSTLTASTASQYQWGYRTTSGTGTVYNITGKTTNSYLPTGMDFKGLDNLQPAGTPGTYYVVCQMRVTCGGVDTWVVSNEVTVYINCDTGTNLAVNGNFSNSMTPGFTSEYTRVYDNWMVQNEMYPEGTYAIGNNPRSFHTAFCDMNSAASRSPVSGGNMLIANAAGTSQKLWTQTLQLKPSTDYVLTFYAASLAGTGSSLLFGLYVNCYRVGDDITGNYSGNCTWQKYSIQMRTGVNPNNPADLTSTFAHEISIVNIAATASGNDVAIDDIEFFECTGGGGSAYFQPLTQYKWRGYSTDWFSSVNWGACFPNVPTCGDDVVIPGNMINYPVINGKYNGIDAYANNLTINSGATLKINNNNSSTVNLNICGNLTLNDGIITTSDVSKATITFTGASATAQKITGTFAYALPGVIINQTHASRPGVELGTDLTINSLLDITNNNSLAIKGYTLTLNGSLSGNTGAFTGSSTSRLIINGSGNLGTLRFTSGSRTLSRLTMNRTTSGQVTLGTDLTLVGGSSALTLTNGIINTTSTNLLTLNESSGVTGSSAYVSGGSNTSHINGPMAKMTNTTSHFTFPTGKSGSLTEIGVKPTSTNASTFRAEYFRQNPYTAIGSSVKSPLDHVSYLEYWDLSRLNGNSNAQVTLFWTSFTGVSTDPSEWNQLRIAHYKSSQWQTEGPGSGATIFPGFSQNYGYVTSDAINSFSPFTWGSLNVFNPLPVELLDLTATPVDKAIRVNWITANEHNSSHFILQRSADGIHFTDIATVQAAGESKQIRTYTYLDKQPYNGINYYRLQQVDKDNTSSLSKIVSAEISGPLTQKFEVYPNPSDGKLLYIQVPFKGEITVTLFNMAGAEVYSQRTMADGSFASVQPSKSIATGMYVVRVGTAQGNYQQKLLVK